jgi:hypothetical protein
MSSSLFLPEFGVKILARRSANSFDLSLVDRAQLLSGFLRGVMGTNGTLNFFVAFPTEWSFVESSVT